jgi:4-hydroxy-tetrahydrodipicolinate synthase
MTVTLQGSITALVTPFAEGRVDEDAYRAIIERQVAAGTSGLVPVGTTGESPTLSMEEHLRVVRLCALAAGGRVPVIAGAGSNNTAEAIRLAAGAEEAGADAVLATTGYYNKPSQEGLYAHFEALHEATSLPIVVYNVPGRTASDVSVETLARLSRLPRIAGIKDATGDLARVARQRLACAPGFVQLSGEDATAVGFNAMGGRGCISVLANVAPRHCAAMQAACLEGRWDEALAMQDRLTPLAHALFADVNPTPAKYALSRLGLCREEFRLPLVPASDRARRMVDEAMAGLDL